MATVAEFTLDAESFPLGSLFEDFPCATIELERIVPTSSHLVPYIWVRGIDAADIESAFATHPAITSLQLVDTVEDEYLLRIEWDRDYPSILPLIAELDLSLLSASGNNETWVFEVRGHDRTVFSEFQRAAHDRELPIQLSSLHSLTSIEGDQPTELTDAQREALLLAHKRGYYDTPREATLEEIADELGISRQALASRLRRGTSHLITSSLVRDT